MFWKLAHCCIIYLVMNCTIFGSFQLQVKHWFWNINWCLTHFDILDYFYNILETLICHCIWHMFCNRPFWVNNLMLSELSAVGKHVCQKTLYQICWCTSYILMTIACGKISKFSLSKNEILSRFPSKSVWNVSQQISWSSSYLCLFWKLKFNKFVVALQDSPL